MIRFFSENINFNPPTPLKLKNWISEVVTIEQYELVALNYIFCSDDYLLGVNQKYLEHDSYTDIITFNNSEAANQINADIFISIDRVKDNAKSFQVAEEKELRRVMVHGVLHLLGYNDKSAEEQLEMRKKEEAYLSL